MVDGFWEETIVANGFLKDFYNSTIAIESMVLQSTIGDDGFSMVFDHRTIAIESMVLQSTIGDDGFSMVNEKKTMVFKNRDLRQKNYFYTLNCPQTDWNSSILSRESCTAPTCNGGLYL